MDRKQRIKLSRDCISAWEAVPAGDLQGMKLGAWLFLIMINDLFVADTNFKTSRTFLLLHSTFLIRASDVVKT